MFSKQLASDVVIVFLVQCSQGSKEQTDHQKKQEEKQCSLVNCLRWSAVKRFKIRKNYNYTSYYPRSTTDVWKGYFYKHQVDFFGSRRCLRRPGFDSYFAPIIKFIRPDYYQCFLSNWDIMVFFGQLTVFLSLDLFCCYGCRACFFGTSQHITCSQSVFASVVPHQDQPIFPCQL